MDKHMKVSMNNNSKYFNKYFENLLKNSLQRNELSNAILYGALNGGKRIRPYMVSVFGIIANVKKKYYIRIAPEKKKERQPGLLPSSIAEMK